MRNNLRIIITIISFTLLTTAGCTQSAAIGEDAATSQYDLPTETILKETEGRTEAPTKPQEETLAPWQSFIDPTQYNRRLYPLVEEAVEKANQDNHLSLDITTLNNTAFTAQGMHVEVLNRSGKSDLQYDGCYQLELIYQDEKFLCDSIEKREIFPESTGITDSQDRRQLLSQIEQLFEKYTLYEEYISGQGFSFETTVTTVTRPDGTTHGGLLVLDGPFHSQQEYTVFLQDIFSKQMTEKILSWDYFFSDAAGDFYGNIVGMIHIGCDFDMVYDIVSEKDVVSVAYLQHGGHNPLGEDYDGTYVMKFVYENGILKIDDNTIMR